MNKEYRPLLQQIQESEEGRINFTKYNFDKFAKHLYNFGLKIKDQGQKLSDKVNNSPNNIGPL